MTIFTIPNQNYYNTLATCDISEKKKSLMFIYECKYYNLLYF